MRRAAIIGAPLLAAMGGDDNSSSDNASQFLVSLIEGSDDAIVSKDLNGIIQTWNPGATRVFGYEANEAVGRSIKMLIPDESKHEEDMILAKIRAGEHIAHYQAIRRHKSGRDIYVSLTISPIRNRQGEVVGASKIARDITEQKRIEQQLEQERVRLVVAEEARELLLREIQHRVKNTLGNVLAVAAQTFKSAPRAEHVTFSGRIQALAAAHALLTQSDVNRTTVRAVVQHAAEPFQSANHPRFTISGEDGELDSAKAVTLSMILHELGTNAVKYGALSTDAGTVDVHWKRDDGAAKPRIRLVWQEKNGPPVQPPQRRGFGSTLIERALSGTQGKAKLSFDPDGLICTIEIVL